MIVIFYSIDIWTIMLWSIIIGVIIGLLMRTNAQNRMAESYVRANEFLDAPVYVDYNYFLQESATAQKEADSAILTSVVMTVLFALILHWFAGVVVRHPANSRPLIDSMQPSVSYAANYWLATHKTCPATFYRRDGQAQLATTVASGMAIASQKSGMARIYSEYDRVLGLQKPYYDIDVSFAIAQEQLNTALKKCGLNQSQAG